MALIKCSECGKEISSNATICPNCGNPIKTKKENLICIIIGFFITILSIFLNPLCLFSIISIIFLFIGFTQTKQKIIQCCTMFFIVVDIGIIIFYILNLSNVINSL